jgi:hypothetical protein
MNTSEELNGALVLVHPGLAYDPAGKQNQLGIITDIDLINDDIFVAFATGEQGRYSADALLMLKPTEDISREAMKQHYDLDLADFKTLLRISVMQNRTPSMANTRAAMVQAMQNDTLRRHSMATIAELYPQELSMSVGR